MNKKNNEGTPAVLSVPSVCFVDETDNLNLAGKVVCVAEAQPKHNHLFTTVLFTIAAGMIANAVTVLGVTALEQGGSVSIWSGDNGVRIERAR